MNNGKEEKGANSTSFWKLLTETKKVQIPIIQRDYAQGREDEKTTKLRDKFLDDLIGAIREKEKTLELDFVYGKVEKCVFQPLDGQQRLTTLYLLHWFLALKTHNIKENKSQFSKFTYETRISSREFCKELVEKSDELGEGDKISNQITDSAWFFLAWKNDPTIKAMLVMLDCIEEKLKSKSNFENLWKELTSNNSPITFHFKELNTIGLTDDLYIKMNARGIPLTDFENFKASFEQHIKDKDWEKGLEDEPTKRFAHKIDTVWTDLFWKHRNDKNEIDQAFIKFIAGIAMNCYAENDKEGKTERIKLLFNHPEEVEPKDFPNKNTFDYLVSCLVTYSENKNDEKLPEKLPLWNFCEDNSTLFKKFINKKNPSYKQRALFYAQTQYLLKVNDFKEEKSSDWMRVTRNIVENTTVNIESFIRAIQRIKKLAKGCADIYEYLAKDDNEIKSGFASEQLAEEVLKAKLIEKHSICKELLFKAEDNINFKGNILNLIKSNFVENENELKDYAIKEFDLKNFDSNTFENTLDAYKEISKDNFETIWGDLLRTSVYQFNGHRFNYNPDYAKHPAIIHFAKEYGNTKMELEEYLRIIEREFINRLIEKNEKFDEIRDIKKQVFVYYIIHKQLNDGGYSDFFKNDCNFGWLNKAEGYQSLFIAGIKDSVYHKTENPIFQTYKSQFRYSLGLKKGNAIPVEIGENQQKENFFEQLKKWAKE